MCVCECEKRAGSQQRNNSGQPTGGREEGAGRSGASPPSPPGEWLVPFLCRRQPSIGRKFRMRMRMRHPAAAGGPNLTPPCPCSRIHNTPPSHLPLLPYMDTKSPRVSLPLLSNPEPPCGSKKAPPRVWGELYSLTAPLRYTYRSGRLGPAYWKRRGRSTPSSPPREGTSGSRKCSITPSKPSTPRRRHRKFQRRRHRPSPPPRPSPAVGLGLVGGRRNLRSWRGQPRRWTWKTRRKRWS